MVGTKSQTAAVSKSFERWAELPDGAQARVIACLAPADAARAAAANKHMDRLVQESWQWPETMRGSVRRGPLPTLPAPVVDALLAPHAQAGHLDDMLGCIKKRGAPVHKESIFEADLECWAQRDEQSGNQLAAEAICRIKDEGLRAPELSLSGLPVRTLPYSLGHLPNLCELYIVDCKHLEYLPDSINGLSSLSMLYLDLCANLSALPDTIADLPNLKVLSLVGCSRLRGHPLPAGLSRPGLAIAGAQ